VLYCVLKLCTVISSLRWAVLTVLWIGFCLTWPISLCLDSFVFVFVFFVCLTCHTAYVLYYCNTVGWTWREWSLILGPFFLQCFDTVGWVIRPTKPVPDMTYNVFGGTLNLTLHQPHTARHKVVTAARLSVVWNDHSQLLRGVHLTGPDECLARPVFKMTCCVSSGMLNSARLLTYLLSPSALLSQKPIVIVWSSHKWTGTGSGT